MCTHTHHIQVLCKLSGLFATVYQGIGQPKDEGKLRKFGEVGPMNPHPLANTARARLGSQALFRVKLARSGQLRAFPSNRRAIMNANEHHAQQKQSILQQGDLSPEISRGLLRPPETTRDPENKILQGAPECSRDIRRQVPLWELSRAWAAFVECPLFQYSACGPSQKTLAFITPTGTQDTINATCCRLC
jgi:hypothetical protein